MPLGEFSIICFEFLGFLVKNCKKEQREKLGKNGPLHRNEGLPRRGEAEGPEKAPSCSPRRSPAKLRQSASPQRRHYS